MSHSRALYNMQRDFGMVPDTPAYLNPRPDLNPPRSFKTDAGRKFLENKGLRPKRGRPPSKK